MNMRIITLSNYVRPEIVENKSKDWVMNGKDNSFYDYIIDRMKGSPTNATVNNSYVDLIYGKGLFAKNAHIYPNQWAKAFLLFNKKEVRKIITDFQVFGEACFEVIKSKDGKTVAKISHLPKDKVIPALAKDNVIDGYWFCDNWKDTRKNTPVFIPAFGTTNKKREIYVVSPYQVGKKYFCDPDYVACLQYAEMEEEISNFCISHIKNGFHAGYIINVPDANALTDDQKTELETKIKRKLTGSSNAGKFILNFQVGETPIKVEVIQINDSHKQWEFLTAESRQQILTGHKVTSPMLFGIKDNTGLGNNADELDKAEAQLMKRVIAPKQNVLLDAFNDVLNYNGIFLDLYFKPLTEQQVQTTLSSHVNCSGHSELDNSFADDLINLGEDITDEWELIDSEILDNDKILQLASTGTARPNNKSEIDGEKFKSRLRYAGELSGNSREFCRKMIGANKLYRIEDIVGNNYPSELGGMSSKIVNKGWGPNGADTYDILLYKGGGACRHYWVRETYRLKSDVNNPNAEQITPAQARKEGEILPALYKDIYKKPNDMKNNGFLNPR